MQTDSVSCGPSGRDLLRRHIEELGSRDPAAEPRWRAAGRSMLLALLASAALQYYFFDVHLTIMTLPRLTVAGATR